MTIDDVKALVHDTVDTNTSNFSNARMVRGINVSLNEVTNLILEYDGALELDEEAYGDLPQGTLNLVSNQKDYNFLEDENTADILVVIKVMIKDASGNWSEIDRVSLEDVQKTWDMNEDRVGIPTHYRMSGKTAILYPTPNYSQSASLKVYFIRMPKPVLISDTIRELSIPSTFHQLVAYKTAYNYAVAKTMANRNDILGLILKEEEKLGIHVSNMDRTQPAKIRPVYRSSR